jgi:hypothetical protein
MNGYGIVRPLLFRLDPERAHRIGGAVLAGVRGTPVERLLERRYAVRDERLRVEAFDRTVPAPVGVAAGFDKNARFPGAPPRWASGTSRSEASRRRPRPGTRGHGCSGSRPTGPSSTGWG